MRNLAIRGIEGDLGPERADTFRRDLHKDLKADDVLANPPFNDSDWHHSDADFCPLTSTMLQDTVNAALVIREHHHVRQL
jgi:type I restriction enzyme M protein